VKDVPTDDARALMLAEAVRTPTEPVILGDALGRTLAEPVAAIRDQPPFDGSAMDGWAVRASDAVEGARLQAVGESAAGHGFGGEIQAGQAVRIFTGAPMARGADTVVIQENTRREGEAVVIAQAPAPGANIRRAGGDFLAGAVLLRPGVRLDPWRLSLAAAAGRAELTVAARPRVAILSTGEELVSPGGSPGPHQIFNSGGPALAALVTGWGGAPVLLTPAGDDVDEIAAAVHDEDCDLIVTVGGASVGDHDLVKPALSRLGLSLVFESLKMRPGKPTWFGTLEDGRRVLGLPGNPASALACAELFLRPLLAAMQGADSSLPLTSARLAESLPANGPREHWMRARLSNVDGVVAVTPFSDQDSSLVTVFAQADALLRRLPNAAAAAAGDAMSVLPLDRL
jgi:molybdopterin molybdotransferase